MTHLLDANVLIALTVAEHEHHTLASGWAAGAGRFALCPIVEGALLRFLLRLGHPAADALTILHAVRALPSCEFWPDDVSYTDADFEDVRGPRQVTDAYLVALAASRSGRLATLDQSLARRSPAHTVLVGG